MAYIIADMRYVLRNRPSTWSPGLRTSFVESFQVFLNILNLIQVQQYNIPNLYQLDQCVHYNTLHYIMLPQWLGDYT